MKNKCNTEDLFFYLSNIQNELKRLKEDRFMSERMKAYAIKQANESSFNWDKEEEM